MPLDLIGGELGASRAERRLLVLQELTAALARTRSYGEIAAVIIDRARGAIRAEVGVVALLSEDGRSLRNIGFKGVDAATEDAWRDYPIESPVPVAEVALRRERIVVRTIAERNVRYPVLAQIHGLEHGGPVVAMPLFVDDVLRGVLAFCWGEPRELDDADLAWLQTLADQCAQAVERARLAELADREIAERRASEARLQEANARKDEFLAMLAHELRNPLAPIRSATDVLATMTGGDARLARVHQVLDRQTEHMKRFVDDLLDVSRLTLGRLELRRERIDLAAVVRATAADHEGAFAAAGIALDLDAPAEGVWMQADGTRIAQALSNLLHNAIKFSPSGTRVSVALRRDPADPLRGTLEVRDQGAGIPDDLLESLYDPFTQADRGLARTAGGLGLGLSLVRGVVELHGGSVTAESAGPGMGATFRVVLPLAPLVEAAAEAPRPEPRRTRRRVLVVEDNHDAAEMLGLLVETLGHEVRIAHAAADGLQALAAWSPDVILSDLGLPDMDGFDFARAVRARGAGPFLAAISGYGRETDKQRARECGFDAHLTKPVEVSALERLLDAG